jgi:hypothetical protein
MFVNNDDIPLRKSNDPIIDPYGRRLLEVCYSTGLIIGNGRLHNDKGIGKFTCCSQNGLSVVDYLLFNFEDFNLISDFDVLPFNEFSDHSPLYFCVTLKSAFRNLICNENCTANSAHKIVFDNDKVPLFRASLTHDMNSIQELCRDIDHTSIDHVVTQFTNLMHSKSSEIFGKDITINLNSRSKKYRNKWFNSACFEAKKEFKRARNIFNKNKSNENRQNFVRERTRYNSLKRKLSKQFRIHEGQTLNKIADSEPKLFWKKIKKSYSKKPPTPDINLTMEQLYDHFKGVFGIPSQTSDSSDENFQANSHIFLDGEITENEIRSAVFSQKNNKSAGLDSLVSEIFKCSFDLISPFLHKLYNTMFTNAYYPESWGLGIITPVFKKGDENDAKNYRGITLINILAKIYSQVLLNRLTKWTQENDILSSNQFGFQKGKSIIDCIFILHSIVNKVLNNKQKLYAVFIDFELCFDKIERNFLWQKLLSENVSLKMTKALKSMYITVKQCVRYKSTYSEFFESHLGLKQGDPSSPLLFMMFVNDINDSVNADLDGIFTYNELKFFLILYADDQVIFAKNPQSLQHMLSDIESYCRLWGLKINTNKTKVMIFEKGPTTSYNFYLNNTTLEVVNSFKYLGIDLYKNGEWQRSQKDIAHHASFALNNLYRIFESIELPISRKCKLFDSLVGSILNFGSELLGSNEAPDIEKVHTKFLRYILGVRKSTNLSALYGELGRTPFIVQRKINMIKYWAKIIKSDENCLIRKIYIMLKDDSDNYRNYNNRNWAFRIKQILDSIGFSNIWNNQFVIEIPLNSIIQRIHDIYRQSWYSEINNSRRLEAYSLFKFSLQFENYLDFIREPKFRYALIRFRVSSHQLAIETGRHENIDRNNRICRNCNMNALETEYHFLLTCPLYRNLRRQYFKPYYCQWPTVGKFESLMSTNSKRTLLNVAKFIYFANKLRSANSITN